MDLITPPFTDDRARQSVQMAEDLWNQNAIDQIAQGFAADGFYLRYRGKIITSRPALRASLEAKWAKELGYTIEKTLMVYNENSIAVQFIYEWRDQASHYFRTYGNESWVVNSKGQVIYHTISSNDMEVDKKDLQLIVL